MSDRGGSITEMTLLRADPQGRAGGGIERLHLAIEESAPDVDFALPNHWSGKERSDGRLPKLNQVPDIFWAEYGLKSIERSVSRIEPLLHPVSGRGWTRRIVRLESVRYISGRNK